MKPLQVTYRSVNESPAITQSITSQFEKITNLCNNINHCHVVVNFAKKHKHHDKLYSVHINADIPRKKVVVTKKTSQDLYVAIRGAFLALEKLVAKHYKRKPIRRAKLATATLASASP